jgi:hypothetical protein
MDLYVYYRVRRENADQLRGQILTMQAALAQHWPVVQPALKRRSDEAEGMQTWMEIYHHATEDFIAALETAVQQAGLQHHIDGARHVETFIDLVVCA